MNPAYELFQKQAEANKQLYTILRFASRCDHCAAFISNANSVIAFLAAQNKKIEIFNYGNKKIDISNLIPIADLLESTIESFDQFKETDAELLFIDTVSEGNLKAMELEQYSRHIKKYIIIPNTAKYAITPQQNIELPFEQKIGMNFGINHFLMKNDNWFILEHDDVDPGMTVLVNRKNVGNAY